MKGKEQHCGPTERDIIDGLRKLGKSISFPSEDVVKNRKEKFLSGLREPRTDAPEVSPIKRLLNRLKRS